MHGRTVIVKRRLLIRSKRHGLIGAAFSSAHLTKSTGRDRSRTLLACSFPIARWSLETGRSVPVSPVWTRATGREPFAIDHDRFGNVSLMSRPKWLSWPIIVTS